MKSIKKVVITLFSVVALSGVGSVMADNSANVSSDGFLELTVQEVPAAAKQTTKVTKKASIKSASQNSAERKKRAQRRAAAERKKRAAAKRASAKRAAAKRAQRSKTYRVRSGDTLTKISKKTRISVSRLVRLNRLYGSKKNHIEVGQRLRLR